MSDPAPDVSVVIPFYNRRKEVAPCLGAILRQRLPPGLRVEVVAVDNGSTDGTPEELAKFDVRVVHCAKRGPAAARNAGIREARGRIVAFTDSDCQPHRDWLDELLQPFADPAMLGTGGCIRPLHLRYGVTMYMDRERLLNQMRFFKGGYCFPPFFATANAAWRREALERVGGFDESLWMSEDADLAWRMLDLGGKIAYCADAVVLHNHRSSFAALYRQARDYGAAGVAIFVKHRARLGVRGAIDWRQFVVLGLMPLTLPMRALVGANSLERKYPLYDAVWRAGFLAGRLRESVRRGVVFV